MAFQETDKPHVFIGIMAIVPMIFMIMLLATFPNEGTFFSLMFFFLIFVVALLGAYMIKDRGLNHAGIPFISIEGDREYGSQTLDKEKEAFDRWDLVLIPAGLGGLIIAAVILTTVGGPIFALVAGGLLLMVLLLRSQTIIVPWMAHALYNITVTIVSQYSLVPGLTFSSSPIFVPVFNFDQFVPEDLIFQAMMQVFAVALMEEMMKISAAMGLSLFFPIGKKGALFVSTIGWVIAHTIISYR